MTTPLASAVGPMVPQTGNHMLCRMGARIMALLGWRLTGQFPNRKQFVAIVAPHTSNWDFFILLVAKWSLQVDVRWMGKDAMFRGPLGWLMRRLGGIPVKRSASHNLVDSSIEAFNTHSQLVLVLAPEGTRKHVADWKSGFWHIARGAGVPIVCVALDYGTKTIRLGPEFFATEADAAAGIARIRASFEGARGHRHELYG